jgi:type II secretory pathway pseudopilin PulG
MSKLRRDSCRAFTLIEAMISTAITVAVGSAVLLGIASSVATTNDVLARAQAAGIAQQIMDEISGQRYCEDPNYAYQYPFYRSSYEAGGTGRERYNDIDDNYDLTYQPAKDRFGVLLGTEDGRGGQRDPNFRVDSGYFANWEQKINVLYVNPADQTQALPAGQTSQYRAVEVTINYKHPSEGTRPLATLRRVFSHVPTQ